MKTLTFALVLLLASPFVPSLSAQAGCPSDDHATTVGDHHLIARGGHGRLQERVGGTEVFDSGSIQFRGGLHVLVYEESNGVEGLQTYANPCGPADIEVAYLILPAGEPRIIT